MGFSLRAEDYTDWEPGPYMAKCVEIEHNETGGWEDGPRLDWKFEVTEEGDYKGLTLRRRTSTAFSPRANARKFAEALLGRNIQGGEDISLEELIGMGCNIQVSINETDRGTFANIDGVYPLRKNQKQGVTPESEAAATAEADTEADFEEIPF